MKITVVGTGYVGLVTGACLAESGNVVLCFDVDTQKINTLINGHIPIYEPGLQEVVQRNVAAGRLLFTSDVDEAVKHGMLQFIAVGTPPGEDGSADLRYVLEAAKNIGARMTEYKVIINKSTVPVGTAEKVRGVILEQQKEIGANVPFNVVSNPEFLKEGAAIDDFMRPDRIIIGAEDDNTIKIMRELYAPFVRNHDRIMVMDLKSAELTKYASNAMLATRISFMNELSGLAEELGADIEMVRQGMGADPRIGYHFLYSGCGYGGSCFPKDVQALINTAKNLQGVNLKLINAVQEINESQKKVLLKKIYSHFVEGVKGKRFALWGLAFKPNTDDMREAPSLVVVKELLQSGAEIVAYDPVAINEAKKSLGDCSQLSYSSTPMSAVQGADALIIVTEWQEFRSPDFDLIKLAMQKPVIFDGRNLFEPTTIENHGIKYYCIGRPTKWLK